MSPDRFFVVQFLFFLLWAAALLWLPFFRPPPPRPPVVQGVWSGLARSATTGLPVRGARLEVRSGRDAPAGAPVIKRDPVSASGAFLVRADPGDYTVRFDAAGYEPERRVVTIKPGATLVRDVFLVPKVAEGTLRIRLSWGERPSDLDLHLAGPVGAPVRKHVCFLSRTAPGPDGTTIILDRDDTNSFGPETLTMPLMEGTFRVHVHDYTNRNAVSGPGLSALARSEAVVDVYTSAGHQGRHTVSPTAVGTLWTVLEVEGLAGTLKPIGTYGSESRASRVAER